MRNSLLLLFATLFTISTSSCRPSANKFGGLYRKAKELDCEVTQLQKRLDAGDNTVAEKLEKAKQDRLLGWDKLSGYRRDQEYPGHHEEIDSIDKIVDSRCK